MAWTARKVYELKDPERKPGNESVILSLDDHKCPINISFTRY